mmetsp:Transcript_55936/g.127114  ORF Transcript_55936/g.127114 Transcript_55936/m.127114 type:complete len:106 (-) Transcript_55936:134-451(-)
MESLRRAQWLGALKREHGGLVSRGVFGEVDRSAVPVGTKVVLGADALRDKKRRDLQGTHCRARRPHDGGRTLRRNQVNLVPLEATRMAVALAAGNDMRLFSADFS